MGASLSVAADPAGCPLFRRAVKGSGFVAQDRGGKDVFVHATTVDRSGLSELPEGQRVRMQISQGQKGPEARLIEILG